MWNGMRCGYNERNVRLLTVYTKFDSIIESKKKYKIIYADPPWQYNDKLVSMGGSAESHYKVMTIDDICNLDVNSIAHEDCILFCWGTWPLTPEIFRVIESWGFEFKTCGFIWIKEHMSGTSKMGMGHWTRGNSEYCLIGVKGKPKRIAADVSQIVKSEIKEHSQKPDIIRKNIVKLCGDLPRIELFARTLISGWDVFGNDEKLKSEPLENWS